MACMKSSMVAGWKSRMYQPRALRITSSRRRSYSFRIRVASSCLDICGKSSASIMPEAAIRRKSFGDYGGAVRHREARAAGARTASGERRDSRDGAEGATRRRFFVTAKAVTHKTTAGACDERGGLGGARFGMLAGMDIKITDVEARVLG